MATLSDVVNNGTANDRLLIADTLFTNPAKVVSLLSYTSGAAPHGTPRKFGTASGYQVPTGKKFIVVAVKVVHQSGSGTAGSVLGLQSATSDIGFISSSEPTSPDITAASGPASNLGLTTGSNTVEKFSDIIVIPAGKYLHTYCNSSGNQFWTIEGFEIDASATSI